LDSSRSIPPASIREALNRVLQSQGFRASRRSQDFLRYVVERTLDGQADTLKERTIGIDVFGRLSGYDPSDDATVRVKAGEVRKRLGHYYASEGQADEIRIDMPAGTYVPEFIRAEPQAIASDRKPVPVVEPRKSTRQWAIPLALAILAVIGVGAWLKLYTPATVVDEFWSPVLRGSAPVLLSAAYVPVYGVDPKMSPEKPTRFEDFVLLTDQFVGGGDLMALARISGLLNRLHHPYRVKIGGDVSFQDLRTAPAVLIGYSYTRWRDIRTELRFFFDAESRAGLVWDNG
jgi:hypothetical protein